MYLVSACLAGINCRYDGQNSTNNYIKDLVRKGEAIPVCPEVLGGLPIPRSSAEIKEIDSEIQVINKQGEDVTANFISGAKKTTELARLLGIKKAILKTHSPSCGYGQIYDGSFQGQLKSGKGLTAEMLEKEGVEIMTETEIEKINGKNKK